MSAMLSKAEKAGAWRHERKLLYEELRQLRAKVAEMEGKHVEVRLLENELAQARSLLERARGFCAECQLRLEAVKRVNGQAVVLTAQKVPL